MGHEVRKSLVYHTLQGRRGDSRSLPGKETQGRDICYRESFES